MWLSLLACADPTDPEGPARDPLPSAWEWEDSASLAREADLELLSASVQALFDQARGVRAAAVHANYAAAMALATETCPTQAITTTEQQGLVHYWDGQCATEGGMVFKGPMTTWSWEDTPLFGSGVPELDHMIPDDGLRYDGQGMMAQADIFAQSGAPDFNCSCFAMEGTGEDGVGNRGYFNWVDGPTHWTGAETAGTWMEGGGLRAGLWQYYLLDPNAGIVSLHLRGGLTGHAERYDSIWAELRGSRPLGGSMPCAPDFQVDLEVRDGATTAWIAASLTMTQGCVACTTLEGVGELCADLEPLFDWEEAPW